MLSKLVCPYCGQSFDALRQHCTKKHHFNWESKVLVDFPGLKSSSDQRVVKYSEHMKKMNSDPDFNSKKVQKSAKKSASARKNLEKINNDPAKRAQVSKLASIRMSQWNSSEEGRRVRSELMLKYHREHPEAGKRCCFRGKKCSVKLDSHRTVLVRSLLEMRVIQEIRDNFDVHIEYESVHVQYDGLDSKVHTYTPDLLIDDCLVIEIKPESKIDDQVVQIKKDAVVKRGFKFIFVSSPSDLYKCEYLVQRLSKV